ncbi:MAG: hypothetical protein MAG551_00478 [Candidatus Scalindua arabica]|uniref:LITAF domain-containing protein n=1 Tax=Candidatus Scalindua arabica TaxID=1127984 RepID=A0A941VZR4_9BACT|nr:hypothetical protein [Candidatus Scalindua arabica]
MIPDMVIDKKNTLINNIELLKMIISDPEQFLITNFYNLKPPKGFRIELLTARKYNLVCNKIKQLKPANSKRIDIWLENGKFMSMITVKKMREAVSAHSLTKHPKKTFCPYCEKSVIPKRLHKLDIGDIVLFLLTAGFWAIFLFAIYFFIRRCPVCNYNLRGFKPLQNTK